MSKEAYKLIESKILEYKKNNILVPTEEMIKSKEQIEGIKDAGIINTGILNELENIIHIGMTTQEIDDFVYKYTIDHNAIPAPLNYEGYPKSVCTSVNDVVCHGIPSSKVRLKDGDIINVDVTTIYNGYYADASRMYLVGNVSNKAKRLVKVTKECLDKAVNSIVPWETRLGDIGYIINNHATKNGYKVVREIGGHGVGLNMHEDPFVFHIGKPHTGMLLVPGMVITIEPMINEGTNRVFLDYDDEWTIYTADGKLSAQWEYTIAITEEGPIILTH